MRPAERAALVAALRWARQHYPQRRAWRLGDGWQYAWAEPGKPDTWALVATRTSDGRMRLEFDHGRCDVATIGEALTVLTLLGPYEPPDERDHVYAGEPGPASYACGRGECRRTPRRVAA